MSSKSLLALLLQSILPKPSVSIIYISIDESHECHAFVGLPLTPSRCRPHQKFHRTVVWKVGNVVCCRPVLFQASPGPRFGASLFSAVENAQHSTCEGYRAMGHTDLKVSVNRKCAIMDVNSTGNENVMPIGIPINFRRRSDD